MITCYELARDVIYIYRERGVSRGRRRGKKFERSLKDWDSIQVKSRADPDLELRGGGGGEGAVLFYLPCWPFSLQSFLLLLPKIRGEPGPPGAPPLDLPLNSVNRQKEWCQM